MGKVLPTGFQQATNAIGCQGTRSCEWSEGNSVGLPYRIEAGASWARSMASQVSLRLMAFGVKKWKRHHCMLLFPWWPMCFHVDSSHTLTSRHIHYKPPHGDPFLCYYFVFVLSPLVRSLFEFPIEEKNLRCLLNHTKGNAKKTNQEANTWLSLLFSKDEPYSPSGIISQCKPLTQRP